jgi:hypothetical protein
MRRDGRPFESSLFAVFAGIAALLSLGGCVAGLIVMIS